MSACLIGCEAGREEVRGGQIKWGERFGGDGTLTFALSIGGRLKDLGEHPPAGTVVGRERTPQTLLRAPRPNLKTLQYT